MLFSNRKIECQNVIYLLGILSITSDLYRLPMSFGTDLPCVFLVYSDGIVGFAGSLCGATFIDSSDEKCGLFTNKKFGKLFFFDRFLTAVLLNVSVIVSDILSLKDGCGFFVFFLDVVLTEITPVTSSSSEMIKPLPTSEEKYMNVFFPCSPE